MKNAFILRRITCKIFIKFDKNILFKRRTKVQFQVKISQKLHTQKLKKNIFLKQSMFFQKMYSFITFTI